MHSAGALQSASSKNRVGEQVTCNVWQLQLSRLSVCVCVCWGCVFVFRWGALRHHRRHRREQRTKSRRELVNLPVSLACHPLSGLPHAVHTAHTPLQRRCVACGMCYKWMTLAALVSSGRHLGQDEYEAECSVSRCLSRLRVLRVFSVPRSVVA